MKSSITPYIFLDFDGTIMTYDEPPGHFTPAVIRLLNEFESQGVCWCTNSGRDYTGQQEILELSVRKGLRHMPAAMLCAESFYYARDAKGGYSSDNPWNTYAEGCIKVLHRQVQHNIQDLIESWRQEFAPEQLYLRPDCTVFLIPDEEERPARFMRELERYVPGNGQVTRNGGWVVVLPVELGKGAVIRAYLEAVGGAANHSLAVGDHINDLSMLDGSAVAYVGCPADAEPEVVQTVRKTDGLVADLPGPAGTLQVIQWFLGKTMGKMFV